MQRKKLFIFGLIVILSLSFIPLTTSADSIVSNEKIENIEADCDSIKTTLKRIQNADRNTRVSIGRSFQSILTDFITPLNVRLVKNNAFNSELADIQNNYANAREDFNRDYISYSQEFETLLSINCKEEPEHFYDQLEKTREKRNVVSESVKRLQSIVDEHVKAVETLRDNLKGNNE